MSRPEHIKCQILTESTVSQNIRWIMGDCIKAECKTNDDAYVQGQIASGQAYERDQNPYPAGTALREWWDGGWSNELDELCGT